MSLLLAVYRSTWSSKRLGPRKKAATAYIWRDITAEFHPNPPTIVHPDWRINLRKEEPAFKYPHSHMTSHRERIENQVWWPPDMLVMVPWVRSLNGSRILDPNKSVREESRHTALDVVILQLTRLGNFTMRKYPFSSPFHLTWHSTARNSKKAFPALNIWVIFVGNEILQIALWFLIELYKNWNVGLDTWVLDTLKSRIVAGSGETARPGIRGVVLRWAVQRTQAKWIK
jgi:hypothetical protein